MRRVERLGTEIAPQEADDRLAPLEGVGAARIRGGGVLAEQRAEFVPLLAVEVAQIRVLQPGDLFDVGLSEFRHREILEDATLMPQN